MQLASEYLNIRVPRDQHFLGYWDLLNTSLAPNTLPYRGPMDRLNKARVALKHHGNLPSRLDLEEFARVAINFLDESTRLVFDVSLDSISMLDFVASVAEPLLKSGLLVWRREQRE